MTPTQAKSIIAGVLPEVRSLIFPLSVDEARVRVTRANSPVCRLYEALRALGAHDAMTHVVRMEQVLHSLFRLAPGGSSVPTKVWLDAEARLWAMRTWWEEKKALLRALEGGEK